MPPIWTNIERELKEAENELRRVRDIERELKKAENEFRRFGDRVLTNDDRSTERQTSRDDRSTEPQSSRDDRSTESQTGRDYRSTEPQTSRDDGSGSSATNQPSSSELHSLTGPQIESDELPDSTRQYITEILNRRVTLPSEDVASIVNRLNKNNYDYFVENVFREDYSYPMTERLRQQRFGTRDATAFVIDMNKVRVSYLSFLDRAVRNANKESLKKEDNSESTRNHYIFDVSITWKVEKYEESLAKIKNDLEEDCPVYEVPCGFLEPDFTPLEKHKQLLEIEEDLNFRNPFFDDDNVDLSNSNDEETSSPTLWESSRQMDGEVDEYYSTSSPNRGLAFIFISGNLINTDKTKRERLNSSINELENVLTDVLGFKVERYDFNSLKRVVSTLQNVSKRNDADGDCFLVAILTIGYREIETGREFLYCGDKPVESLKFWSLLDGSSCPILGNKPKIFIQLGWDDPWTSKGIQEDSGRLILHDKNSTIPEPAASLIPNMCHFFIISAIEQERSSLIEKDMVNNFIDNFVSVVRNYGNTWDLVAIMTEVIYKVSHSLDIRSRQDSKYIGRSQVQLRAPSITSSLIRKLIFKPKTKSLIIENNN